MKIKHSSGLTSVPVAIMSTFRLILEADGHEVWDAENGRVGVDICRHERPDLVITDMIMPEQEGFETLSILHHEFPGLPVIAMSGAGVKTLVKQGEWLNGDRCVAKPVDKLILLNLVHSVLLDQRDHKRGACSALGEDGRSDR